MDRSFLVLYELGRRMGSKGDEIIISSAELGDCLGISQQSASRYLSELEEQGFIERIRKGRGQLVRFTGRGLDLMEDVYRDLRDFIEERDREFLLIEGRVTGGLGEGAYYIREYADRLEEAVGFTPFFGTLNIKPLKAHSNIEKYAVGVVNGFRRDNRTFGEIRYMPVKVVGEGWEEDCYLIKPKRTHHVDEFEIISRENLREKYGIKDGDLVKVRIG